MEEQGEMPKDLRRWETDDSSPGHRYNSRGSVSWTHFAEDDPKARIKLAVTLRRK